MGLLVIALILKVVFHHMPCLARALPESCVLILVGINFGIIIRYIMSSSPFPSLTAELFFHYLLPPIILDSAIALYDEAFLDNFLSILVFAILGTLINTFSIGYSLYGLSQSGMLGTFVVNNTSYSISSSECLIFSSLISAGKIYI